jgi:hypothetical protein
MKDPQRRYLFRSGKIMAAVGVFLEASTVVATLPRQLIGCVVCLPRLEGENTNLHFLMLTVAVGVFRRRASTVVAALAGHVIVVRFFLPGLEGEHTRTSASSSWRRQAVRAFRGTPAVQ